MQELGFERGEDLMVNNRFLVASDFGTPVSHKRTIVQLDRYRMYKEQF